MYTLFGVRNSPNRAVIQQENNITARKPGLNTRKPLADHQVIKKGDDVKLTKDKSAETKEMENLFEFDVCSYKEVPDNYNDISINGILTDDGIDNISAFFGGKMPKTPPVKKNISFEPQLVENVRFSTGFNYDLILNDIRNTNIKMDDVNIDDAPMPDFDDIFNMY